MEGLRRISRTRRRGALLARIAAALISGLGYALLFPPFSLDWLSWVFLVPLLLAMRGSGAWRAGALAALFAWVGTIAIIAWLVPTLHEHFEQSLGFSIAFWLVFGTMALCPYYAVLLGLAAYVRPRVSMPAGALLFAAAWVAAEYTRVQLGFQSPWTRLGDAHAHSVHVRQIADLGGVYAISGLVALVNAALAETIRAGWAALRGRFVPWEPVALTASAAALAVALTLTYGSLKISAPQRDGQTLRVAIVQGNVDPELRWRRATARRVFKRYGELTRDALVAEGPSPDLVVWPENAIQTSPAGSSYGEILRKMADGGVALLVGAPHAERGEHGRDHFNSAHLLLPDGRSARYDKRRLLPFSETRPLSGLASFGARGDLDASDYTPGRDPGVFEVAGARLGVLICMEALYPSLAREAVGLGADVLVNVSNDGWYRGTGGAAQHLEQVVLRAVETRTPVVRATTTGISAVVAPTGAVLASIGQGRAGVLELDVPTRTGPPSLYARAGDAFAIACLACVLGAPVRVRLAAVRATTAHFGAATRAAT